MVDLEIMGQTQNLGFSGAGVINVTFPLSFAGVPNGATRYGTAFDEQRLLSCSIRIIPLSASNGITAFFFSEKPLTGAATAVMASQRNSRYISNSNGSGNSNYVMNWKADGFLDLSWDPVLTSVPAAYFTAYTESSFGSPTVAGPAFMVQICYRFQMRGIANT